MAEQAMPGGAGGRRSWEPEQLLADRYRVKACVRESGTCQLFRVQDVFRGNFHLLMRPSPRVLERPGGKEWFEQYGRSILSVPPHVNVLTCERMAYEATLPFLIMEDLDARGWHEAIKAGELKELGAMVDVALQVARGLAWLHEHGRVHYNVKPSNVLVGETGLVKVWKYGESEGKTRAYASPEQMSGDGPITRATDVWSWGASVLQMFIGRVAWKNGPDVPTAFRRYLKHGPAVEGVAMMPGNLAQVMAVCLKPDPADRGVPMDAIADVLGRIGHGAAEAQAAMDDAEDLAFHDELDEHDDPAEPPSAAPEPGPWHVPADPGPDPEAGPGRNGGRFRKGRQDARTPGRARRQR